MMNPEINQTTFSSGELANGGSFRQSFFMPEIRAIELFLSIAIFIAIHSLRQRKQHGLPVWPIIGMLPSLLLALRGDIYDWISGVLCRTNGTFKFKGPWFTTLNAVITSDPRNLEHLLKRNFSNFPKGPYFRYAMRDFLGDGIFNADDDVWRQQRKAASLEFHSAKFRNLTSYSLLELVHSRLLPVLEDSIKHSIPIDLQDVLLRLTFDNVCMIAFGADPGCLRHGLPEIPFAQAFEDATEITTLRFVTPKTLWKVMRFLNLGPEKKLKKSIKEVDEFANKVISDRKKELSLYDEGNNPKSDLLTAFMGLKDDEGKPYSDKFLRDICVNFILAGRDTSSVALSWFFWLLEKNPAVEDKILAEIYSIVGKRSESDKGEDRDSIVFKPEEVKKMEYLQAALSETLRLYPSVPVDQKEVIEDEVFPNGTVMPKGEKVIYAMYAMGRMKSIWGKDCREFKPERWMKDGRYINESAYKFTAFNGGPRLCLGKDFAYYQMKFVASSMIYRYQVKVVENYPVVPKFALTMYMKYGLKVMISKRD
ncbi:cytochrome P450 86B1-like [Macadamia integrifolia]|uniref:cytochrome P450 86B1-like n=1 Tax=Macadamia integrifolia TaxID=60698 RepID=UPI001C4F555B|nr:cytochrome P450 86B1-like [Macadamia integrifolia]